MTGRTESGLRPPGISAPEADAETGARMGLHRASAEMI